MRQSVEEELSTLRRGMRLIANNSLADDACWAARYYIKDWSFVDLPSAPAWFKDAYMDVIKEGKMSNLLNDLDIVNAKFHTSYELGTLLWYGVTDMDRDIAKAQYEKLRDLLLKHRHTDECLRYAAQQQMPYCIAPCADAWRAAWGITREEEAELKKEGKI